MIQYDLWPMIIYPIFPYSNSGMIHLVSELRKFCCRIWISYLVPVFVALISTILYGQRPLPIYKVMELGMDQDFQIKDLKIFLKKKIIEFM